MYQPVHPIIPVLEGIIIIALSILLLQRTRNTYNGELALLATGLLSMGVIDLLHGIPYAAIDTALLQAVANLCGSLWFALIWLPAPVVRRYEDQRLWLSLIVAAVSLLIGMRIILWSSSAPLVVVAGAAVPPALAISTLAGLLFLVAVPRFILHYRRSAAAECLLFAGAVLLLGLSDLLVPYPLLAPAIWSVLRLAAGCVGLWFALRDYWQGVAERRQSEEQLQHYRMMLEQTIAERTEELARTNEALQAQIAERKRAEETARAALDMTRAHAAELQGLKNIAEALNRAVSPLDALYTGLEVVSRLVGSPIGWLWLISDKKLVYLAATYNLPPELALNNHPLDGQPLCECLQRLLEGRLTRPAHMIPCPRLIRIPRFVNGLYHHISLPITSSGQPVGVLNLVITERYTINARQMRLFSAFRNQFGVAVERSRLFHQITEGLAREQRLNEMTRTISSALDLPELLEKIVRLAAELIGADAGAIGLLSQDSKEIAFPCLFNLPDTLTQTSLSLPRNVGLSWQVVESGSGLIIADYRDQPHAVAEFVAAGVREVIVVPLIIGDTRLGALSLFSLGAARHFSERDLALAESIGRQAATAIQNARLFSEVQQLAITDSLTGLYNRRHFFELFSSELERTQRYNRALSVIMLDVDHFKLINDSYGHILGDQVLRTVAVRCRDTLRTVDVIGRYGGEEFAILLPETDTERAWSVAERLRQNVMQTPIDTGRDLLHITISAGVTTSAEGEQLSVETLIERADQALYAAKQAGRNRVLCWSPALLLPASLLSHPKAEDDHQTSTDTFR